MTFQLDLNSKAARYDLHLGRVQYKQWRLVALPHQLREQLKANQLGGVKQRTPFSLS